VQKRGVTVNSQPTSLKRQKLTSECSESKLQTGAQKLRESNDAESISLREHESEMKEPEQLVVEMETENTELMTEADTIKDKNTSNSNLYLSKKVEDETEKLD